MSVLLVDGDNLLTIGFYGAKNDFYKGRHFGGIFHFINTLRRLIEEHNLDKICVFWDGKDSSIQRKKIYHLYKENRKSKSRSEEEDNEYKRQRIRIQQYLEEVYIRQGEYEYCETDDCIAYYTQISNEDKIIIYSSDRDLAQLVNDKVSIYNPSHRKLYSPNDFIEYDHEEVLIENVKIIKMLCGDASDNIYGIKNLGIKTLIKLFPEIKTKKLEISDILNQTNILFEQDKESKIIQNILTGVSKVGVLGEEFFEINQQLIDLSTPLLNDEAKSSIYDLINEKLDKEGRSYKNIMKMMTEDGIFVKLPSQSDKWINFLNPFLRLTRKEKNKHIFKIKK